MVDYQYLPDMDDPLAKLRLAMDNMDGIYLSLSRFDPLFTSSVETIHAYKIPDILSDKEPSTQFVQPAEDANLDPQLLALSPKSQQNTVTRSNLRLFPPPLFSRQTIPQGYKFRGLPFSPSVCLTHPHTQLQRKFCVHGIHLGGRGDGRREEAAYQQNALEGIWSCCYHVLGPPRMPFAASCI